MKKNCRIIILLLSTLLILSGTVFADDLSAVKESGVLRFGTSTDYVPFVFMDGTDIDGLDVALVKEVGKRMGVDVQVYDMAFDGLPDAVTIGQVDLIGGALTITEQRKERMDFTNPYYESRGYIVGQAGKNYSEENILSARVGVQKGTSFEQWATTNLLMGGHIESTKLFRFSHETEMMAALGKGEIELALLDGDVYRNRYKNDRFFKVISDDLCREKFGYAGVKGSTLIPEVNRIFKEMVADGTAQNIANRYFAMDFSEKIVASITRPEQIDSEFELLTRPSVSPDADLTAGTKGPIADNKPNCINGMQYVSDVNLPDSSSLPAGQSASKTWRIKNTGTCTWDSTYSFTYVKGELLGVTSVNVDRLVAPNETYDITVPFTTPSNNGNFTSYWQMQAPTGLKFGQTIWINFNTKGALSDKASNAALPKILKWQPDYYKNKRNTCPTVYWQVTDASHVEFYINNKYVDQSDVLKGSMKLCPPRGEGTFTYGIIAVGEGKLSDAFSISFEVIPNHPEPGTSANWPRK